MSRSGGRGSVTTSFGLRPHFVSTPPLPTELCISDLKVRESTLELFNIVGIEAFDVKKNANLKARKKVVYKVALAISQAIAEKAVNLEALDENGQPIALLKDQNEQKTDANQTIESQINIAGAKETMSPEQV